MPAQQIDGKWYSDELGRFFDPSKETSMGAKVTTDPRPTSNGVPMQWNPQTRTWQSEGARNWETNLQTKMQDLIARSKGGDAQAIWDLTRIQEAGNLPSQFFNDARQATNAGQGIISQNNRNWFLQQFPQYSRFIDSSGNLTTSPDINIYQSLRDRIPTSIMSPQSQIDFEQAKRNQLIQNLKDQIYERKWREAYSGTTSGLGSFLPMTYLPTIAGMIGGPLAGLAGSGIASMFQPKRPDANLTPQEQAQLDNLKNIYGQRTYNPWARPNMSNMGFRPQQSSNPFTSFNQTVNNPFTQQPTRPQQPANQAWLNMIGR